jgi:hypothetical protein
MTKARVIETEEGLQGELGISGEKKNREEEVQP